MKKTCSAIKTLFAKIIFSIKRKRKILLVVVLVAAVAGLGLWVFKHKSQFVVARVNGKYILRRDLNAKLIGRYGAVVLEDLITLRLVEDALAKENITVSGEDVDNEISQLEATLMGSTIGGMTIEDFAASQGLTVDEFREQVTLQLKVRKLAEAAIEVKDAEVGEYLKANEDFIVAETEAERTEQAREMLINAKMQEFVGAWINQLRDDSGIVRYL